MVSLQKKYAGKSHLKVACREYRVQNQHNIAKTAGSSFQLERAHYNFRRSNRAVGAKFRDQ